jgi:hypothetical protein
VDQNLREHFDRAVSDDPGAAPGEMAQAAIIEGGRLRRRRNRLGVAGVAAGVVAAVGAVAGMNTVLAGPEPVERPSTTIAAAMMPVAAQSCTEPVETGATDVAVFLDAGLPAGQRSALESALNDDPRVATLVFENRAQAYERFRARWAHAPDFVAAVSPDSVPESFRLRLANASQYTALRAQYAAIDGVSQVVGRVCPVDAPVGGVL